MDNLNNREPSNHSLKNKLFEMADAYGPKASLGYLPNDVHLIYSRYFKDVDIIIEYIAAENAISIEIQSRYGKVIILGFSITFDRISPTIRKTDDCEIPNFKSKNVLLDEFTEELEKLGILKEFLLINRAIVGSPLFNRVPSVGIKAEKEMKQSVDNWIKKRLSTNN
ncbi:hypothetical protein [Cyclobacterium plantarum]|uniref:hypothetical protein n=1 Tax=Cyclobacterium plantarum TaxID=2716263 RepID=UPI003F6FFDE5